MSTANEKIDLRRARGADTRRRSSRPRATRSARRAAETTTRSIAERAGVQLSLVHYHFEGKQQLLAEVLTRENDRLLERQRQLFAGPGSVADKWRAACAYLDEDLRSGYVRILWELWAVGLSEPDLAARWRAAISGWRELIAQMAAEWSRRRSTSVPPRPDNARGECLSGGRGEILAGLTEQESPHLEALESIGRPDRVGGEKSHDDGR